MNKSIVSTLPVRTGRSARREPLSIAHVLITLCIGGAERVALMLAARQARSGHRTMVISFEEPPGGALAAQFEAAGARVVRVPKRAGLDWTLPWRLAKLLRHEGVDVVHTHNSLPLIYAAPAAKAVGARVVHTKHGPHPATQRQLFLRRLGAFASDAFVAVSNATAASTRELGEVSAKKLSVIANATDLERFRPDPERRREARRAWGVPDEALIIGTVGRLAPVKNHALLIRAVAPLLNDECQLVIAGEGPDQDALREYADALSLRRHVHFLGAVHEVPTVMAGFDIFALTSVAEGLPLVLVEAMAFGIPVVATDVGGVPRVVRPAETGLLVPSEDVVRLRGAIEQLAGDPALREKMGRRARRVAESEYSDERMVRQYMELCRA